MAVVRLEKYLADAGIGTRSQIKEYLKHGRVTVDGFKCTDGSRREDYAALSVYFDGNSVCHEAFVYYLLNKPQGCVSATKDALSDTVVELLKGVNTKGLFPVGRLDKDTEGLLLITNDGQLAHQLLSPKKHVEKTYYVNLDKPLSEADRLRIEDCIDIGDEKPCLRAKIEYAPDAESGLMSTDRAASHGGAENGVMSTNEAGAGSGKAVYITITEGRYHQVKRMFAACGYEVTYLKRISMGTLSLPAGLNPGEFLKIEKPDIC
ncbi:MAG: rRNA pseudouridine synthase [Lachnospiraceae bacterium]|nr:rRNA pseudouridine synthase [Lachnospiraceae bacterium]